MSNGSVSAARRAMERELKQAEADVARLKNAIRALAAYENPRSAGVRMPNKGQSRVCKTKGCGTHFTARRSDARFCSDCKRARSSVRSGSEEVKARAAEKAARDRQKGVALIPGAKK